jgi:hypothetical protein
VHQVTLSAYAIDKLEVTNEDYRKCVTAGACQVPTTATQYNDTTKAKFPVVFVDYARATAYCAWAGKRLPTEAEWEKAARSTDQRNYPWGAAAPTCTLNNGGGATTTTCSTGVVAVGSYPTGASPYGVLDMAGNAREWVYDWAGIYPSGAVTDPAGPPTGTTRLTRGGSYGSPPEFVQTWPRVSYTVTETEDRIGFRCAKGNTPKPVAAPHAVLTVTPSAGTVATTFAGDASQSTDPVDAASTLQYRWRFGDGDQLGPYGTTKTVTHKYAANGSYKLTVEVRNSKGYSTQGVRTVTVNATGAPPDMAGGLGEGESCDTSDMCSSAYDCYAGFCREPCFLLGSCPTGYTCSNTTNGYCLPTGG